MARLATHAETPNGILDGARMEVHGDLLPALGKYKARYHVSFLTGLLAGCGSTVEERYVIFDTAPRAQGE